MPDPCIICGGQDLRHWDTKKGIPVLKCCGCGHGCAAMPEEGVPDAQAQYDGEYYAGMGYDRKWRFRVGRAERWLAYIGEIKPPPGDMLDVGCSLGPYLEAARRLGWTAYGTDVSRHALGVCEEKGFRAFWSMHPDDFPDWLPPLDVVTATHVVEHFPDPVGYLQALRGRMKPGAVLYVQLPNFARILRRGPGKPYFGPPGHLQFFTPDTARRALEMAGYEAIPIPRLRPRYIGRRLHQWLPEVLYQCPREALREAQTRSGKLSNMHLFGRVPG